MIDLTENLVNAQIITALVLVIASLLIISGIVKIKIEPKKKN